MKLPGRLLLMVLAVWSPAAWAAPGDPRLGYLYPAGGKQGTTFQVSLGGQYLSGANQVLVSGEGVRASLVWHTRPLSPTQIGELRKQIQDIYQKRRGIAPKPLPPGAKSDRFDLPDHPLLNNLDALTGPELEKRIRFFRDLDNRRRISPQLSEAGLLEVTIDPNAAPGIREVRLRTPAGLTNPVRFHVDTVPEQREPEPSPNPAAPAPPVPPATLPVILNGQVLPGEVDRFRLQCRRGQRLVVEVHARSLMPYLADAVPGWFQAALALYDSKGREVAFVDDYRFDPDPVLFYEIPEDGEYVLEIRDAIYRGREDFVYRLAVGERPFITRMFPLGGRIGEPTTVSLAGWNLPEKRLTLDTQPGGDTLRRAVLRLGDRASNPVLYAVDDLPECTETEANDTAKDAQRVVLPVTINGIVSKPGDRDVFRFEGKAGDEIVAEVLARRLGSPLDSLLRLVDASGHAVAWNDDQEDKATSLLTHHADSYLRARLPKSGAYFVYLTDSQQSGSESSAYRLRISAPRPDYSLRLIPSSLTMPANGAAMLTVHAFRKDGFDGEIELALVGAPTGFLLSGGRIPRGRDSIRVTVSGPREMPAQPFSLRLEGRAQIGGRIVAHPVSPADDMMQAFYYHHLVPAQELTVVARGALRRGAHVELTDSGPVRIPAGGSLRMQVKAPWRRGFRSIQMELRDPPKGITLQDVAVVPNGLAFVLKADAAAAKVGTVDNLIIEAFMEMDPANQDGGRPNRIRRFSMGFLPAIPIEITAN